MDCTICHKPIELVPSAEQRAKKYGGKPSDYTRLFTEHAACVVSKRNAETLTLIQSAEQMRDVLNATALLTIKGGK